MARIRVVTDSAADIPEELRREAGIGMVPLRSTSATSRCG